MNDTTSYDDWALGVAHFWRGQGIGLQSGVPGAYIEQTAKDLGFVFPPAFISLYKVVNGFKGNDWTPGMFVIWPLERMFDEYRSGDDQHFVGFADFFISSHLIGFRKGQSGIFHHLVPEKMICEGFDRAIKLINEDSVLVH